MLANRLLSLRYQRLRIEQAELWGEMNGKLVEVMYGSVLLGRRSQEILISVQIKACFCGLFFKGRSGDKGSITVRCKS